ncbi:hypothetical protein C0989_000886 [Termitomyces sp. Mn162]|nr:hypothetical protein C0989_000886 [Termitomyces sp. Mn162]
MSTSNANNCPLAKIKVTKLKDCPMLTLDQVDIEKFQECSNACHHYLKHLEKKPTKYLMEFAKYALPQKWVQGVRNTILASKQGSRCFLDWKIKLKNSNALLTKTKSVCVLSNVALQAQLEANIDVDLHAKLDNINIIAVTFVDLVSKLTELDKDLREENTQMQRLIDANNAAHNVEHQKWKLLVDHLSELLRQL